MKLEIKIKKGLDELLFGSTPEAVRATFGEPDETEELDNQSDGSLESIVWNYVNTGLNFFFDCTGAEPMLTTIESDNLETVLAGQKIFQLSPSDLLAFMKNLGFDEFEEEDETWGEHRITFDEAQIDFYFSEGELNMVSWSHF
ncbi:MAG: hypothetical protein HXX13_13600 [Bacteroidetes bacterium]|nr:hypothetical protein [Bacteroidota bacterium]